MNKNNSIPTVDELISYLTKSTLPTVVIEGQDDSIVFRKMEDHFQDVNLSILPAGGRENVLKIFNRMAELQNKRIAFIADQDEWVMSTIPVEYLSGNFFFTDGYSVENDIFRDGELESILSTPERMKFLDDMSRFAKWYVLTLQRNAAGLPNMGISTYPGTILDDATRYTTETTLNHGEIFPDSAFGLVTSQYARLIRGKSLMQILGRQINATGRSPKYSPSVFLEIVPSQPGPLIKKIFRNIGEIFGSTTTFN